MSRSIQFKRFGKVGFPTSPEILRVIDRLIEAGYNPEFLDDYDGRICFNSKTYNLTVIKIQPINDDPLPP